MRKFSRFSRRHFGDAAGRRLPVYLATFLVWLATGVWHGASWNFIVWGLLNWAVLMLSEELEPLYARFHMPFPRIGKSPVYRVVQILRTLLLVCCLNLFDCYPSLADTFRALASMLTVRNGNVLWDGSLLRLGLSGLDYGILAAGVMILLGVSLAQQSGSVRDKLAACAYPVRFLVWYGLFLAVLLMGAYGTGIAPLFYTVSGGRLIFASEIKAILECPGVDRKLNLKAVDQLMNFPGAVSPTTFFEGIHALEGGHMLRAVSGREPDNIEYWDLRFPQEEDKGEAYYVEKLRELLKDAVARRLVADVPVGFYISGGLDSSVVACIIGKYMLGSTHSFSAEIGSGELDESRFQKIVRDCVGSAHYSTAVCENEIWANLGNVIYHAESAVKETYDVAAYLLSSLVSRSPVKAVLTGQGSDEFFCGYVGYLLDLFRGMRKGQMTAEECALNERLWGDPWFRYERNHPEIRKFHRKVYSAELSAALGEFSALAESPICVEHVKGLSAPRRRSYIDYKLRLSDHMLGEHGDRMFFSYSVEGRHPFLDKDLLSFVVTIPDRYKLNGANEKYILKKAAQGIVPDEILKRRKFPFQAPGMSALVKSSGGGEFLSDALIQKYGIFDVNTVNEMKRVYSQDGFSLMGAYEIDYLLIVMTVTMLCERFSLSV